MTVPDMLVTTYLEMTERSQFQPAFIEDDSVLIQQMTLIDVEYYLFLYRTVGEKWRWRDRLLMPQDELTAILQDEKLEIHVVYAEGVPAGYVELLREGDNVEVAYFGLREQFTGRGLGKHLLSFGVDRAWHMGARRVWLHTCNLDGPYALSNYQKRGFVIYDVRETPMPEAYL